MGRSGYAGTLDLVLDATVDVWDPARLRAFQDETREEPGMGHRLRAGRSPRVPEGWAVSSTAPRARTDGKRLTPGAVMTRGSSRLGIAGLVRARAWPLVVWTAMLGWSVGLFAIVRSDYGDFRFARFDLGNMVQAVWSTAHGRPLEMTDATGEQIVRFASHVDPILVLLAPLWIVAPTPLTLASVQIVACALGALPVFWLARRHLSSEKAAALHGRRVSRVPMACLDGPRCLPPGHARDPRLPLRDLVPRHGAALGLRSLCGLGLGDGRADGAAPRCPWALVLVLPRSSSCRADDGRRRTRLDGDLPAGSSSPPFGTGRVLSSGATQSVGGSPWGIAKSVFTDPAAIVSALGSGADVVVSPLARGSAAAGVFLLSPALAAARFRRSSSNGLSDWPTTTDPRHHYIAGVVPFLLAASVLGLARLPRTRRVPRAVAILAAVGGAGADARALARCPRGAAGRASHRVPARRTLMRCRRGRVGASERSGQRDECSRLATLRTPVSLQRPRHRSGALDLLDTWNTWMPGTASREEGLQPELIRAFLDRVQTSPGWRSHSRGTASSCSTEVWTMNRALQASSHRLAVAFLEISVCAVLRCSRSSTSSTRRRRRAGDGFRERVLTAGAKRSERGEPLPGGG